jgi:transposase InsO family protein
MGVHKNAPLTPVGRANLVHCVLVEGQTLKAVATAFRVCPKTVRKWVDRYKAEGPGGLKDRSSRPHCSPNKTPLEAVEHVIELRRHRLTEAQIAVETGLSKATVARIAARAGLNRLKALDPVPPVRRYERASPGEMIHVDIKKLGRFHQAGHRVTGDRMSQRAGRISGWEYVHVCIDDASRIACAEIKPDEKKESAIAALVGALAYYKRLGIAVQRVMTDNGSCYRSHEFSHVCRLFGLKHIRTRPYTPKTNGKAERFIQSAIREWAYAKSYQTSAHRAEQLPAWLHRYNWHRPHASLKAKTPMSRLGLAGDNVLRLHS